MSNIDRVSLTKANQALNTADSVTSVFGRTGAVTAASADYANVLKLDDCAAPDDNTDLNASTAKHGLLPKLDNNASNFLNGQGSWAAPTVSLPTVQYANLTADFSTTSTNYTDLTGLSITETTAASAKICLWFSATHNNSGANSNYFIIDKDGSDLTNPASAITSASGGDIQNASLVFSEAPTAAAHTYKIQVKVSAGTLAISASGNPTVYSASLLLMELPA